MSTEDRATQLERWSEQVNSSVVRLPGRRYPGVVLQGDSLSILFDLAMHLLERLPGAANPDLREAAEAIAEKLFVHVRSYESALEARGLAPPYVRDPRRVPPSGSDDRGT